MNTNCHELFMNLLAIHHFYVSLIYYQELENLALRSHASLGGLPHGGPFSISHNTP